LLLAAAANAAAAAGAAAALLLLLVELPPVPLLLLLLLSAVLLLLPLLPFQIIATSSSPATAARPFCTSGFFSSAVTCCCRLPVCSCSISCSHLACSSCIELCVSAVWTSMMCAAAAGCCHYHIYIAEDLYRLRQREKSGKLISCSAELKQAELGQCMHDLRTSSSQPDASIARRNKHPQTQTCLLLTTILCILSRTWCSQSAWHNGNACIYTPQQQFFPSPGGSFWRVQVQTRAGTSQQAAGMRPAEQQKQAYKPEHYAFR
jgi:hypothetical protein